MKKLIFISILGVALINFSCSENSSKKSTEALKINPWKIFYKLVPNTPQEKDVIGEGSYDNHANPIVERFILCPQIKTDIGELVKVYGNADTITDFKNVMPFVMGENIPEYNPIQLSEGMYQYNDISGKIYKWGEISLLTRKGKVFLIFIYDSTAKPKIFAPQIERK